MNDTVKADVEAGKESDGSTSLKPSFQGISLDQDADIPAEAWASLERLLAYEPISRAPRLRAVLKFMVDALLEGRAKTINEHMIGEVVFGRSADYNPGDDNIVRVTIRHLRDRLEEFYRTDGRDEQYAFEIPKGRYVPNLIRRQPEQSASSAVFRGPLVAAAAEKQPGVAAATAATPSRHRFVFVVSWIIVCVLSATVAVLGFRLHRQANSNTRPAPRHDGLLSLLLANGKPTTVVVTDSNLQAYRMIFQRTVPLDAYLDRSYIRPASDFPSDAVVRGAWNYVGTSAQTSLTSMIIASEIQSASLPKVISIKYPRNLSMRDIEHGNYIFLGGPWIDPWEQLFEGRLNFRVLPPPGFPWGSSIHNMNPAPPEPAIFVQHQEGSSTVGYVRFALLRNLIGDGYTVLLSGTSDEAVEAGARFLISEPKMDILLRIFKVASPEQLPSLEVVIETTGLQDVPENFRVVAERVVKTQ